MLSMLLLFAILLLLLLLSYNLSYKKLILTPQFGFVAGFLLSVGYGLYWVDEWNLALSMQTFLVLAGGTTLFVFVTIVLQRIGMKVRFKYRTETMAVKASGVKGKETGTRLSVERWKLIVFLVFQAAVLLMTLYYLIFKIGGGLAGAMYAINSSSKTEEESIGFPFILRQMRNLSFASSFFWAFFLSHSLVYKYKCHRILLALNIALSMLIYLLGGARQGAIQLILSILVMSYVMWGELNQWKKKIKTKTILKVCLLGLAVILSYQMVGNLFGRNFNIDANDYIAAYIAAPIKNLDTFIRKGNFGQGGSFAKTQTFAHIANQLEGRFGLPLRAFKFDQPYNYVGGHYLGNVYTTFYAFLYDGGYPFLVCMILLMAVIVSFAFIKAIKPKKTTGVRIALIIYSYMFFECLFAFFTCWFFARTFNTSFLYYCIYWGCLKFYVERVKSAKWKTVGNNFKLERTVNVRWH